MDFFRNEQYEYIDLGPDKYAWLDDVLTPRLSLDDLETLIAHTDEYMPPAAADEWLGDVLEPLTEERLDALLEVIRNAHGHADTPQFLPGYSALYPTVPSEEPVLREPNASN